MTLSPTWKQHPSLLWHYPASAVRHLRAVRPAQDIRAEFENYAADGQFNERWFDTHIVPWCATFRRVLDRSDDIRILEIGSWEGRSTLFLLTYFPHGKVTAVDTWAGNEEYQYTATADLGDLESRFDRNVSPFAGRVTKRKGMSIDVLPQLLKEQQQFDVIYVDGSHFADDVLVDAVTAWRLLKQDGVLIFDDFEWDHYPRRRANPGWAISQFLSYHPKEYRILSAYYQIIVQKTVTHTDHVTDSDTKVSGRV